MSRRRSRKANAEFHELQTEVLCRSAADVLAATRCETLEGLEAWLDHLVDAEVELRVADRGHALAIDVMNGEETLAYPFTVKELVATVQREADDRWSQREDEYFDDLDLW